MNVHDNSQLEIEEPLSIQVKEPASTKKNNTCLWLRRIVNIDDASNQKHHFPVFIIVMCILHIFIHLLTYINVSWKNQNFATSLHDLFMFFVPCMRPTPEHTRIRKVICSPSMVNTTCYYDDELKQFCFSFMYPHQLWRMITVNLVHMNWSHLLSNLSKQLLYGIPLERKYGSIRLAAIYWLSDIGSSLTFMLKNSEKRK
jgi:membrane associated rhomboid family serine protease